MRRRRLVKDWKECHRWYSVRIKAVAVAIMATWALVPANLTDNVPDSVKKGVVIALLVSSFLGQLVEQNDANTHPPQ